MPCLSRRNAPENQKVSVLKFGQVLINGCNQTAQSNQFQRESNNTRLMPIPTIPDHWEILNFPSTLEIHDKRTGNVVHAVPKGDMVIGGSPAALLRSIDDESDYDLRARLVREALAKATL